MSSSKTTNRICKRIKDNCKGVGKCYAILFLILIPLLFFTFVIYILDKRYVWIRLYCNSLNLWDNYKLCFIAGFIRYSQTRIYRKNLCNRITDCYNSKIYL